MFGRLRASVPRSGEASRCHPEPTDPSWSDVEVGEIRLAEGPDLVAWHPPFAIEQHELDGIERGHVDAAARQQVDDETFCRHLPALVRVRVLPLAERLLDERVILGARKAQHVDAAA